MPRPRLYVNSAERQAAYRERLRGEQPVEKAVLARLAQRLHTSLREAVEANQSILPAELLGHRADDTLRNLIRYVRQYAEAGKDDALLIQEKLPVEEP